jgi:SAM-dependent methyltransferase
MIRTESNRSHPKHLFSSWEHAFNRLKDRILARGDLPHASATRQLQILIDFVRCRVGQFLVERGGANAYWTDYLITRVEPNFSLASTDQGKREFSETENFLLNQAPIIRAHRERFRIFQEVNQSLLRDSITMASIPCGIMRDLLTLDYSKTRDYHLYGIDLDEEALDLASKLARQCGVSNLTLIKEDAWNLSFREAFDVINSSGLNVYEPNRELVIELYAGFHRALRTGGVLICGVLTYPPHLPNSDWDLSAISQEDLWFDRVLHEDILNIGWRQFRHLDEIQDDFFKAGFSKVEVKCDSLRVFPTVIAHK